MPGQLKKLLVLNPQYSRGIIKNYLKVGSSSKTPCLNPRLLHQLPALAYRDFPGLPTRGAAAQPQGVDGLRGSGGRCRGSRAGST